MGTACREEPVRASVPHPEETTRTRLRVACLNVWGVPFAAKDLPDRMRRLAEGLSLIDADVLCFQEVFTLSTRLPIARALGETYALSPGMEGGLLIASRLPMRDVRFTAFPVFENLRLQERLAGKGFLEAVVSTKAGLVRVVTAHLAIAFGPGNPKSRQLAFLLKHLEQTRHLPVVLAADLNVADLGSHGQLGRDYASLLAAGFESANPPRPGPGDRFHPPRETRLGWPRRPAGLGWAPDHVLLRAGAATGVTLSTFHFAFDTDETAVSDHHMLVVDIDVEPLP